MLLEWFMILWIHGNYGAHIFNFLSFNLFLVQEVIPSRCLLSHQGLDNDFAKNKSCYAWTQIVNKSILQLINFYLIMYVEHVENNCEYSRYKLFPILEE
jgi:hypothetical protein